MIDREAAPAPSDLRAQVSYVLELQPDDKNPVVPRVVLDRVLALLAQAEPEASGLVELLRAYKASDETNSLEWFWLDEIEKRIGREAYKAIMYPAPEASGKVKPLASHAFEAPMDGSDSCARIIEGETWTISDPIRCRRPQAEHPAAAAEASGKEPR